MGVELACATTSSVTLMLLFFFPKRPVPLPDGGFRRDAPLQRPLPALTSHTPNWLHASFGCFGLHLRLLSAFRAGEGFGDCAHG